MLQGGAALIRDFDLRSSRANSERVWKLSSLWIQLETPFKDEAQTALFKDPVRTSQ